MIRERLASVTVDTSPFPERAMDYIFELARPISAGLLVSFPELRHDDPSEPSRLRGRVADQAELFGILSRFDGFGLTLVGLRRVDHPPVVHPDPVES